MTGSGPVDRSLRERAGRVIPGGLWGHLRAASLPEGYPQFFRRGEGCRIEDVDGKVYVDLMCSWGPIVLGHGHPAVERAAQAQRELGDCLDGPGEVLVRLAERVVGLVAHADWVMFQKNGTDATTACVMLARAGTGRRKVLVARGSYHGSVPWCSPSVIGVTTEDRAHLITFDWGDTASLDAAVAQAGDDLAAIILTAFRHDVGRDQEMPTRDFLTAARTHCDRTGAMLICDDVRAGFRLDVRGSWAVHGVKPDLAAYSKAIANGWPLAAIAGADRARDGAEKIFTTGSFWYGAAAMAAGLATVRILRDTDALAHTEAMGNRFRQGLDQAARRHGYSLRQTGPVQMPMVLVDGDQELRIGNALCLAALRHGVYLHPKHNMFLCTAHQAADIDAALVAADVGFEAVGRL